MTTEWVGWANITTTDKPLGDNLGAKMNPDPGAIPGVTEEFVTPLRPIGSNSTTPTAWFTAVPMKQLGLDMLAEFNGPGPYNLLALINVSPEEVALAKPVLVMEYGDRATYEGHGLTFIASQGYEIIPNE